LTAPNEAALHEGARLPCAFSQISHFHTFRTKRGLLCFKLTETRSFSSLKSAAVRLHRSKTGIFQRSLKCFLFTSLSNRQKTSRFGHSQAEEGIILARSGYSWTATGLRRCPCSRGQTLRLRRRALTRISFTAPRYRGILQ